MAKKTTLKKFFSSTTIHGLSRIAGDNSRSSSKVGWALLFVFSLCFAVYTLQDMATTWANSPIDTTVNVVSVKQVPFPVVTVCPKGLVRDALEEHIFNMVEINDLIKDTIEDIMATLLKSRPITVPAKQGYYSKMKRMLCQGVSGYCSWSSDKRMKEKSIEHYKKSCAEIDDEKKTLCRFVNPK